MSRLNTQKLLGAFVIICAIFGFNRATHAAFETQGASPFPTPEVFTKCWDYTSLPDLSTSPAADSKRVYFLNLENKLEAADLQTATKLWSTELGGEVISNLLAVEHSLLVVSSVAPRESDKPGRAILRSLSKQTGVTNWSTTIPIASRVTLGAMNGTVVSVDENGVVEAFGLTDGARVWRVDIGAKILSEPHIGPLGLMFATDRKQIQSVSATGQTSVIATTEYLPTAVLLDSGNRYLIGDERGNLRFVSAEGSVSWKFKNGARISFLLAYDSEFLVTSFDNFIYKLSRSGNVEWKRRLTGRLANKPLISGDTAVVSIVGDNSIYFIDLKGGKISNRIEVGDENVPGRVSNASEGTLVLTSARGLALYSRVPCQPK